MFVDGISNISGGITQIKNGLKGSQAGDTGNFMKNAYIGIGESLGSAETGQKAYDVVSLGVSVYSIGKGVSTIRNAAQRRDVIRTEQGNWVEGYTRVDVYPPQATGTVRSVTTYGSNAISPKITDYSYLQIGSGAFNLTIDALGLSQNSTINK